MSQQMKKKFDKDLYNKNDPAKLKAIDYFGLMGMKAIVNPDDYGVDLIVDDNFYCEVEVKHNWKGTNFPFSTLQIPERKTKFAKISDKPVMFMVFNSEHTHAFLAKATDVLRSRMQEVPNKYVPEGEMFFQVPVKKLTKVRLGV